MKRVSRLNNRKMEYQRKELTYEAVMIDLYLMGAIEKDLVEQYINCTIPDYLVAPARMVETQPDPTVQPVVNEPTQVDEAKENAKTYKNFFTKTLPVVNEPTVQPVVNEPTVQPVVNEPTQVDEAKENAKTYKNFFTKTLSKK